jgi:hypothetical protein
MNLKDFFISVETFPEGFSGLFQLLTLAFGNGYILMYARNLISDGSELVPSIAGLVGSVVLPILGAVPDGCIGKSVFSEDQALGMTTHISHDSHLIPVYSLKMLGWMP